MAKKITEKQAELLVERLVNRVEKTNARFLKEIGKSIDEIGTLMPSKAQELVQMLKYGGNYQKLLKELESYSNMNIKDIDKIFKEYSKVDSRFYEQFYKYRDIPFKDSESNILIKQQTDSMIRVVKEAMYNFTRDNVMGYTFKDPITKVSEFHNLRETYNKVLDIALLNVGQGKETFNSAMSDILEEIGGNGLRTLNYKSGRSIRLDSAVRMHLKDRLSELHNENQRIYGQEFDYDGIEISVHENPAPDHEDAQGRQFSKEEFDKLQKYGVATTTDGIEIDMHMILKNNESALGFRPISAMNCYHYIFPIILGISKPEYTNEELEKIKEENDKEFVFEGATYNKYQGTQLQRALERKIREQKDIQIVAKASNNTQLLDKTERKITMLTNKYSELSKISGLPMKLDRLKVEGYKYAKPTIEVMSNTSDNKNIMEATHITKEENYESIIKNGFTLDKAGTGAGTTLGKGIYFTTKENELKFYKTRIGTGIGEDTKEIKANIDTTGFLKVKYDDYTAKEFNSKNNLYDIIADKLKPEEKQQYLDNIKELKRVSREIEDNYKKGIKDDRQFSYDIKGDSLKPILEKNYPGLILEQNTEGLDIVSGGNQIVVYDTNRIKLSSDSIKEEIKYKQVSFYNDEIYSKFYRESGELYNTMSEKEVKALEHYAGRGYEDINITLLNGKVDDFEYYENQEAINEDIKALDSALGRNTIDDNILVYRGTLNSFYDNYEIGDIITSKMYTSTSLSKGIAERFATKSGLMNAKDTKALIEIRVPKGTSGLYIGDVYKFQNEQEILLNRNLKYKLISKKKINPSYEENGIYHRMAEYVEYILEVVK